MDTLKSKPCFHDAINQIEQRLHFIESSNVSRDTTCTTNSDVRLMPNAQFSPMLASFRSCLLLNSNFYGLMPYGYERAGWNFLNNNKQSLLNISITHFSRSIFIIVSLTRMGVVG